MLVTTHVRIDGSLLMEGEAGAAVASIMNVTGPPHGGPIVRWIAPRRTAFRARLWEPRATRITCSASPASTPARPEPGAGMVTWSPHTITSAGPFR